MRHEEIPTISGETITSKEDSDSMKYFTGLEGFKVLIRRCRLGIPALSMALFLPARGCPAEKYFLKQVKIYQRSYLETLANIDVCRTFLRTVACSPYAYTAVAASID